MFLLCGVIYIVWRFFIHLGKALNHLPLPFMLSVLYKRCKLWVIIFGCSDVMTLTRIMTLVRILFLLKVIMERALLYIAFFLVCSVRFWGAVSIMATALGIGWWSCFVCQRMKGPFDVSLLVSLVFLFWCGLGCVILQFHSYPCHEILHF